MTIDEAIEILTLIEKGEISVNEQAWIDACKLGIEALKLVREYHEYFIREGVVPLLGETKENE